MAQSPSGNTAAPQLAEAIGADFFGDTGGTIMLAVIAAVAFATILAVVAGLTLASSSSFAHDIYASVIKRGQASDGRRSGSPGSSAFVIGAVGDRAAIYAQKLNVAFLVALAFAVAASANLPAILYSPVLEALQHHRRGRGDLRRPDLAVVLVLFSPVVSGKPAGPTARACR